MIHVFLICLACCCSSLMPLKQSESIVSEDHIQVVESKSKRYYLGGDEVNYFTASDFLANSFGEVFYKEIGDLQAPATSNLPYTSRTTNTIEYNYESESVFGWALQGGYGLNLFNVGSVGDYYSDYYAASVPTSVTSNSFTFNGVAYVTFFLKNTTYDGGVYSLSGLSSSGVMRYLIKVYDSGGNYIQNNHFSGSGFTWNDAFGAWFLDVGSGASLSFSVDSGYYFKLGFGSTSSGSITYSNIMLNAGSSALPYQPYFIGGYPSTNVNFAIRFLDIKKEYFANPDNNTYMYHYTMDFSASRPGVGKTRIFSIITDIMPEIKRVDTQGNLWPGGFWSYTYIDLNRTYYDIPLNSFMYGESSATGQLAPILNKYIRNLTYGDSYQGGYDAGYDNGYNIGNNYGYQRGYSEGIAYAQEQSSTALTIFTGIIEVGLLPVNVFLKMFEYEVFGINIAGLVSGLITIAMIMILLRFIFGGRQNGK